MVWAPKELLNALLRDRAQQSQAAEGVENVRPGSTYSLPKRNFTPRSNQDISQSRKNSFIQQMGVIGDTYDFEPSGKVSPYLEQAEDIMFQANKLQQKREKRLSNPILKQKPFSYDVNVPMPVAQPVKRPDGSFVPQEDVTRQATNKMPKLSQKQTQAYEKAIIAGKSHLGALKAIGVKPIYEKGTVKVPNSQKGAGALSQKAKTPNTNFDAFVRAIAGKESGGSYSATNPSGASGKYQILRSNFEGPGGWDRETIGREVSYSEFMSSPKVQDAIAKGKLRKYYEAYGPQGAASAWYSGSPNNWKSTASQGAYPSVAAYVQDIMRRMGGG